MESWKQELLKEGLDQSVQYIEKDTDSNRVDSGTIILLKRSRRNSWTLDVPLLCLLHSINDAQGEKDREWKHGKVPEEIKLIYEVARRIEYCLDNGNEVSDIYSH